MHISAPAAITVEHLSKQYRIGRGLRREETLREALTRAFSASFRRRNGERVEVSEEKKIWALKDISFEVGKGEIVGIIGRNGAGKSTLLKILSRVTEPTSGRAEIRGRIASLLEVGTGFHGELTGRENIYLNGAILGMTRTEIRNKFDEIVAFAEIDKFIDTPVKRYSSGMYVRLAYAIASHLSSDILLLDEVLAVGDAGFQNKCFNSVESATNTGRTVILVSHNLHVIKRLCRRAILLEGGTVGNQGDVNSVIEAYQNAFHNPTGEVKNNVRSGVIFEKSEGDGNTEVFIERIELLDANLHILENLSTWDSFVLRICYKSENKIDLAAAELHVTSLDGVSLMKCGSYGDRNDRISLKAGRGHIDCILKNIELAAGRYQLGVGLAVAGIRWLCFVRAPLEIAERDVYDSGFPPKTAQKYLAPQFEWVCR